MSLQDNIDQAGTPLALLTAGSVDVSNVFPYPPVYTNWRDEQRAWAQTAVLLNQSFHMSDLFIAGPDVRRLLSDTSVNSYQHFRAGTAKQYIAVNPEGYWKDRTPGRSSRRPPGRRSTASGSSTSGSSRSPAGR